MLAVLSMIGWRPTPERVKSETTARLERQAKRVDILAERIRQDYRDQDARLAGRR